MAKTPRKNINLALQGGGAHGAFTWGVLDCILEDDRLNIEAISGTSAGAMNAVALADGLADGGRDGARQTLHDFWEKMSELALYSPINRSFYNKFMGSWGLDNSMTFQMSDAMSRMFSPYQFNPFNINPLRSVIEKTIDFDRVRVCTDLKLYISATNVETGRVHVFKRELLDTDRVLASACLPNLYQAIEIDGVPYWDGGYVGNPALFPFYDESISNDIVVVQINPIERKGAPTTAQDIQNRINEIAFNASLLKEYRAIDFVARLIEEGKLDSEVYRHERIHIIQNDEALAPLGASSKMNAEWSFLVHLKEIGYETTKKWISKNYKYLGVKSTVDLRDMFQGIIDPDEDK